MKRFPAPILFALLPLAASAATPKPARPDAAAGTPAQATKLSPIQVEAKVNADADADGIAVYGRASLHDTPASVTVIDREQLERHHVRTLSELARLDASLGDSYAPVGYYQNIAIRGFPLDLGTGYRSNNLIIVGEQVPALEAVQKVEILKGLAGIDAGVMEPGGVVNYVAKRPADVRTTSFGTDSHGSRYAALDVGRWLTPDFGVRANLAWEDIHSYVRHADGRRNFYALAADWRISERTTLQLDANYQARAQRSVSGYQLLGGDTVPADPNPEIMLGYEPWQQPVTIDAANTDARLETRFADDWRLSLAAGHSRSVIQDNVAFAYGCYYTAACAASGTPGNFFAPNGDYDIYDYRSPDDTRVADSARATLSGDFQTGAVRHQLSFGLDVFHRTIDNRRDVNEYVGSANIGQLDPPYYAPSPLAAGPSVRTLDSWQRSAFALDRIHFGDHWQWLVGGRFVRLSEHAWDDDDGSLERATRMSRWLPQTALVWQPTAALTTYASWSEGLSLGTEAPFWTSNDGAFLGPRLAHQIEAGVKYAPNAKLKINAALFRIREPWQHAVPDATAAGFTYVARGERVHTGVEFSADGRLSDDLGIHASVAWIRARGRNGGIAAYESHQLLNVPAWRASVGLDYRLPWLPAVSVGGSWRHAAKNPASYDGKVEVAAWDVFDAGFAWRGHWQSHAVVARLGVSNLFDHRYWRDTGSAYGDRYLFPGAPRLARFSLKVAW